MDKRFTVDDGLENVLCWEINDKENEDMTCGECAKLLNELYEENQALKFDNKELIRFITSKGYTLQDYIKFIGQFQSVGVNKECWE